MSEKILKKLREICLSFPQIEERESHGSPCWFIKGKKQFAAFDDHHHGVDHVAVWCPAPPGAQDALIDMDPDRFFRPPYVGHRGWVGVRLDRRPDWTQLEEVLAEAYRHIAPKKLLVELEDRGTTKEQA